MNHIPHTFESTHQLVRDVSGPERGHPVVPPYGDFVAVDAGAIHPVAVDAGPHAGAGGCEVDVRGRLMDATRSNLLHLTLYGIELLPVFEGRHPLERGVVARVPPNLEVDLLRPIVESLEANSDVSRGAHRATF